MVGKVAGSQRNTGTVIQFTLFGLVVFSISLVLVASVTAYALTRVNTRKTEAKEAASTQDDMAGVLGASPRELPPWGELVTYDVEMDRPDEYIAFEVDTNKAPAWIFEGMNRDQAGKAMQACGLNADQVRQALASTLDANGGTNTVIKPSPELLFSLSPAARTQLYSTLARFNSNHYMVYPFCFPGNSFATSFGQNTNSLGLTLVKRLLYNRGQAQCFSDFELVIRSLPSDEDRVELAKALSRQSAVLMRVRIRKDTDIDRLLGYWGRGVQSKDVRPLIESIQRLDGGGTVSAIYLLPKFVRERLYTYPFGSNPGDPAMDCHWTTMNFFSETPDNRFANPTYTVDYLQSNYYRIAQPSALGDRLFFVDDRGNAIHSAVYIADNVVFTKNGNNFTQPWTLMRLNDLLATYSKLEKTPQVIVYREKSR